MATRRLEGRARSSPNESTSPERARDRAAKRIGPSWVFSQDAGKKLPNWFRMEGFWNKCFNVVFRCRPEIQLGGCPTYWDAQDEYFVFFQDREERWAICPRKDGQEDLLEVIRSGGVRGLAYEEVEKGVWAEYKGSSWVQVNVRLRLESEAADGNGRHRDSRSRAKASSSRGGVRSFKDMKHLLKSRSDVEEVFLMRGGGKEAQLVIRFASSAAAAEAEDIGRNLLGPHPQVVDSLSTSRYRQLRGQRDGCYKLPGRPRQGQRSPLRQSQPGALDGKRPDSIPVAAKADYQPHSKARPPFRPLPAVQKPEKQSEQHQQQESQHISVQQPQQQQQQQQQLQQRQPQQQPQPSQQQQPPQPQQPQQPPQPQQQQQAPSSQEPATTQSQQHQPELQSQLPPSETQVKPAEQSEQQTPQPQQSDAAKASTAKGARAKARPAANAQEDETAKGARAKARATGPREVPETAATKRSREEGVAETAATKRSREEGVADREREEVSSELPGSPTTQSSDKGTSADATAAGINALLEGGRSKSDQDDPNAAVAAVLRDLLDIEEDDEEKASDSQPTKENNDEKEKSLARKVKKKDKKEKKEEKKAKKAKKNEDMEARVRKEVEEEFRQQEAKRLEPGPGRRPPWSMSAVKSFPQYPDT